jgi:L-asparaginase II
MVEVVRGGRVESRHRVSAALCDAQGGLVASMGDPGLETFYRSAAKPFQALPLVEDGVADRFGLTGQELALCCASHEGEAAHVACARSILARAGLDDDALRCGPQEPFSREATRALAAAGMEAGRIHNNCSGKHAGMLLLAVGNGWPPEGYHRIDHPVQRRMMVEVTRWSGIPAQRLGVAVDGCGVLCFAVPLRSMARSFAAFAVAADEGGGAARIVSAMVENPFMVGGTGRACTAVMERTGSRAFVKLGAEGVYGGGLPDLGLGFAVKVEDGGRRAVEAALVRILELVGVLDSADLDALSPWGRPALTNTLGDVVGEIRARFDWSAA